MSAEMQEEYESCAKHRCPPGTGAANVADATPVTNPTNSTSTEIQQLYNTVLNRDPDPGGFEFWTGLGAAALNTASSGETVPVVQVIVISFSVPASPPTPAPAPQSPNPESGALSGTGPRWTQSAHRTPAALRPAAFLPGEDFPALAPGTLVRFAAPRPTTSSSAAQNPAGISYSIVSNGKSSGEALELQVLDPSGKVKQIGMPEGLVLEPVKRGAAQPVSARAAGGAHMLTKQLTAYCLEFSKLPPDLGMQYRVAPQALQNQYKPVRGVLRAGREAAAAGKFHPDSEPRDYADTIRQYAVWAKLGNWDQQKFSEMFLERSKKNAEAMNVKWTKNLEQALAGLVHGRWQDVSMVLREAEKLPPAGARPGEK